MPALKLKLPKKTLKNPLPKEARHLLKTLDQIQQEQKRWAEHNFPTATREHAFLGMVEELGELAHVRLKLSQKIREGTLDDTPALEKDAIGDLLIFTMHYCNLSGWKISEILQETWDEVGSRDWVTFPKNGVSE